ncbi:prepilin peptidase [Fructobacillus ficulneus]|uniref:prepilin peptidase n=1 Tax=Fructobacillus ficulneus TaxID=157463 RepID=UPI000A000BB7
MNTILLYLINLVIASWVTCLADRSIADRPLWTQRSYCLACHHVLSWYDLIPLVSAFILRGHCRSCQAPYATWKRLLLVEGVIPLIGLFVLVTGSWTMVVTFYLLVFLALEDWATMTCTVFPAWIWAGFLFLLKEPSSNDIICMVTVLILVTLLSVTKLLGWGDVPVILIACLIFDSANFALFIIVACLSTLVYLLVSTRRQAPFIPFLTLAFVLLLILTH